MAAMAVVTSLEELPEETAESMATGTTAPASGKRKRTLPNSKSEQMDWAEADERKWIKNGGLTGQESWKIPNVAARFGA